MKGNLIQSQTNIDKQIIPQEKRDKINVFIPIRDREISRARHCVQSIKKNNLGLVGDIILVDIGSKKPLKEIKGTKLLRLETNKWNKAWGLNCAIRRYPNEYIMTLDVDMLLDEKHFEEISKNLHPNSFIIDTNVRRIDPKRLNKDYLKMIELSKPWRIQDVSQLSNKANGGVQVYSFNFFKVVNGIQESLGLYHGSVDNVMVYRARMWNLNVIDMSFPLLHIEHKNQKEENYSESERVKAREYRGFKADYLNHMISHNIMVNPEKIGGKKPNTPLFKEFLKYHGNEQKLLNEAYARGEKDITIGYTKFHIEKKPSVLLCVINNYGSLPSYFVWDLITLRDYTLRKGIDLQIQEVSAANVAHMRNMASELALRGGFDYLIATDVDHRYPPEFIVDFIKKMKENDWPILTPLTPSRIAPYYNTQYYKFQDNMNTKENTVNSKRKDEVIEIEASGPVGMIIRTDVFSKIKYPYYLEEYFEKGGEIIRRGSDLSFCKQLKEAGIPIRCDLSVSLPHETLTFINRGKLVPSNDIYEKTKRLQ